MTVQSPRRRRTKAQMEQARRRRDAARKANLKSRHNMTPEQYAGILEWQGGVCYLCRRAKGLTRALQVDHDHAVAREFCSHDPKQSCEQCWRGLLCSRCNGVLAHARDLIEFFKRAIEYLTYPPAQMWRCKEWRKSKSSRSTSGPSSGETTTKEKPSSSTPKSRKPSTSRA